MKKIQQHHAAEPDCQEQQGLLQEARILYIFFRRGRKIGSPDVTDTVA